MNRTGIPIAHVLLAICYIPGVLYSQDLGAASCQCEIGCQPLAGGCWWDRPQLTGDWHGVRPALMQSGMVWEIDHTTFSHGVTAGGIDRRFTFAGHGDYVMNWDLSKVGLQEGLFVKLRGEHRYGESISRYDGAFLPATTPTSLPVADSNEVYLTNVLFTQFLSESFAVFGGKLDTLDGDVNAFAHRRGKDQFSNMAFVANPLLLRSVPYSTLACGFSIVHEAEPIFTFTVLNPTDTTTSAGFNELFAEGVTLNAEGRIGYDFYGAPGHQLLGGSWSSREYVSLGQDPRILLPDVPIDQQSGTWSLYWNADQYLSMYDCAPGKGWGVFGRAGIADDQANPLAYFLSAGIGGDSPFYGRQNDRFGVGYYYLGTSDEIGVFLQGALGTIGDGQGAELFYNYEVTPWCHLTGNMQVLVPEVEDVDTALLIGLRAKIDF
ncbi:MAG: carbohydrate porin [Pirellulaceae bacterium]